MRKWIAIAVAVLLVLVAGGLYLAASNLNAWLNENREWLAAQASKAAGRQVAFEELEVTLAGGLGIRVAGLRVKDDPAFSAEDFLRAGDARVNVRILPALFGRIDVARVVIEEPRVVLIRTAKGLNAATLGGTPGAKAEPPGESTGGRAALLLALLEIRGGELRFVDRTVKPVRELTAAQIDFEASDVSLDSPIGIDLAAAVLGAQRPNLRVSGSVGPLDAAEPARTPVDLELSLAPVEAADLERVAPGALPPAAVIRGPVALEARAEGSPERVSFRTSLDARDAAVAYGGVLDKPAGVALRVDAEGSYGGDQVEFSSARLALAEEHVEARGKLGLAGAQPYDLSLESAGLSLARVAPYLPAVAALEASGSVAPRLRARGAVGKPGLPSLEGSVALQSLGARPAGAPRLEGLSANVSLTQKGAALPRSSFQLGGSPAHLEATLEDWASPRVRFGFGSPALRVESLGLMADSSRADVLRDLEVAGTATLPAQGGPTVDATMRSPSGSLRGLGYERLEGRLRYRDDRATLEQLSVVVLGGTFEANGSYDVSQPGRPVFDLHSTLKALPAQGVVAAFAPSAPSLLRGILGGEVALKGAGSDWSAIKPALSGDGSLRLDSGELAEVNLAESVLTGLTGVPGLSALATPRLRESFPALFGTEKTTFDALQAKLEIAQGRVLARNLRLAAKDFAVTGDGSISLDGDVALTARFLASDALTRALVGQVSQLGWLRGGSGQVEIPFRVTGPVAKLRARPDTEQIASALVRGGLSEGLQRLLPSAPAPAPPPKGEGAAAGEGTSEPAPQPARPRPEDLLRDLLRKR